LNHHCCPASPAQWRSSSFRSTGRKNSGEFAGTAFSIPDSV
jgi:hypothetical protein